MTRRRLPPLLLLGAAALACVSEDLVTIAPDAGAAGVAGSGGSHAGAAAAVGGAGGGVATAGGSGGAPGVGGAAPGGRGGAANVGGTGGPSATGATSGAGGVGGSLGAAGTAGIGGSFGAAGSGGAAGSFGAAGIGGATGGPLAGASGASSGAPGIGGLPGNGILTYRPATFTQIYTEVIAEYCAGSRCHIPRSGRLPDYGTREKAYAYFTTEGLVQPGMDPEESDIFKILYYIPPFMPPAPNDPVPDALLELVGGWILAGAKDD